MKEITEANKRKQIIERYLAKLSKDDPNLYYASAYNVARDVHRLIKEQMNYLDVDEQNLVRKLSVDDVAMILGFNHSTNSTNSSSTNSNSTN
ncbi:hypothetical protein MOMA_06631 [Moraxella macacae 0408225]|uniref:Uncharacterized protein n=1 Tax=Moraxella macacae 0408225 TaxID=1230338 RepID=L2F614_9GAMM|nr:hypothetical protein [Moraxella macacae]ELA08216.1 hypothetical protein MOMA_06631 [Moraxella macacae 0408225]